MDPSVVADIDVKLDRVAADEGVALPLVVESGSRAWGFPSPDSDYDCRFIFVRRLDDYLTPWPRRDVIETPLDKVFDVNGWELGKALKLLIKGNAVVIEWLRSPIVYRGDEQFRNELLSFADAHANRRLIGRHYLRLGEKQRRTHFGDGKDVPQKKIFYALRPAAALRWLRMRPQAAVAPMHFPTLMAECDPPADVLNVTSELLALKAVTNELGTGPLPSEVGKFIDDEFELARELFDTGYALPAPGVREEAADLFRRTLQRFA